MSRFESLKYFRWSFLFTLFGLIASVFVALTYSDSPTEIASMLLIVVVLSILEISLSFDNAIVNAAVIRNMTELWRKRFLTWGILIAVFGMRFVFPLAIVSISTGISPWAALDLAISRPDDYAKTMLSVHIPVSAYGGMFLLMVCFNYFFDHEKEVHWLTTIERFLAAFGRLKAAELGLALLLLYGISQFLGKADQMSFIVAGIFGLLTYIAVDALGTLLQLSGESVNDAHRASLGMFLYLEVLDASFSFDGVIGAFALSRNIFIIMIGLGIGAMYVRSLTIMLVEKQTLNRYPFLEHGAFYAIGALAVLMLMGVVAHIPEYITGLVGAVFIVASLIASIRYNRANPEEKKIEA